MNVATRHETHREMLWLTLHLYNAPKSVRVVKKSTTFVVRNVAILRQIGHT
jgi:hypothetical protein